MKIFPAIKIILLALILSLGISYAFAAWTPPPASPPDGNADAPINVGPSDQVKNPDLSKPRNTGFDGGLAVGKLAVFGQVLIQDGTEGEGKYLVSDDAGIASWSDTAPGEAEVLGIKQISRTYTAPADGKIAIMFTGSRNVGEDQNLIYDLSITDSAGNTTSIGKARQSRHHRGGQWDSMSIVGDYRVIGGETYTISLNMNVSFPSLVIIGPF